MTRAGVLTAGTWVVDRNITVDLWPDEDMLATVQDMTPAGGGPGCNFAVALRRLDPEIPVETQGLIGAGEWGDFLLGVADAHGIDRRGLRRSEEAGTPMTDAYLSARSGRRTHIFFPGTAPLLTPDHFDLSATGAGLLHLGLPGIHDRMDAPWEGDANGWVTVLRRGRAAGLRTNMELVTAEDSLIRRLVLPCLPHLDTLVVNDAEIGALAGRDTLQGGTTDMEEVTRAVQEVLGRGAMSEIVVHFPTGAVYADRDGTLHHAPSVAIPDAERVGANGAGDAFAAGYFLAHLRGWPPQDRLRMGHASAAASLRAADTCSGITTWRDCLDRAAAWGWRDTQ
ncbi:carbohydrate kinase family protein [Pseudoponticoccus marisrubri]|uniref:Carbohydrate kinase PfkB domain-containing protein n=1 Tax=Pseudoponticoccus marisrubri TaxID=1685382 RepID=A0A0W7WDY2_9RHOB|nr:carbohydrate kinase family protein [Pseudoponticoccus marisrubri]KUF08859.1 hypothetical protein AVJ23_20440 [Pseudoponticoccus marisrubri]